MLVNKDLKFDCMEDVPSFVSLGRGLGARVRAVVETGNERCMEQEEFRDVAQEESWGWTGSVRALAGAAVSWVGWD